MAAKRSPSKKSKTQKKPAARKAAKKAPARKARPKAKATAKAKAPVKAKAKPKAPAGRKSKGDDRLAQLERLVEMMVERDVVEVELEEAGARWRVRRTEPQAVAYAAAPQMAMPAPAVAAAGDAPAAGGGAAPAAAEPQGEVFKSPMLGTYYQAASPDAEAFVKVGDRVNADTTLCIVEAMKVMNEIKAEREFEILEILVKNGEPVEFGQPMFLIR